MALTNRHARYLQQAGWTRHLRTYLFETAGLASASSILEVGCGTGAVLSDLPASGGRRPKSGLAAHGLDLDITALLECRQHVNANLVCANGLAMPYPSGGFDIVFCHFFLLWVGSPVEALIEMKRVARLGGHVLVVAEPDYGSRSSLPYPFDRLASLQQRSLKARGADTTIGSRLSELVRMSGLKLVEAGRLSERPVADISDAEADQELEVLRHDLQALQPGAEWNSLINALSSVNPDAMRIMQVPTYFAHAQV